MQRLCMFMGCPLYGNVCGNQMEQSSAGTMSQANGEALSAATQVALLCRHFLFQVPIYCKFNNLPIYAKLSHNLHVEQFFKCYEKFDCCINSNH